MVRAVGKDEKHIHKVTCPRCASILEYTLSEVTYSHTTDYSGVSDPYNYIICPVCNPDMLKHRGYVEVKGR